MRPIRILSTLIALTVLFASLDTYAQRRQPRPPQSERMDDERFRELMDRARRNGGRLELTPQEADQLMKEFQERFFGGGGQGGNGLPGLPGFEEMMQDMLGGSRGPGRSIPEELLSENYMQRMQRSAPVVHERAHPSFLSKFDEVTRPGSRSTVRILADDEQLALGTIVDADGLILTKATQMRGDLKVQLSGGKLAQATVIGVHEPFDLAMLKIDSSNLTPIRFKNGATQAGTMVAAPGPDNQPLAAGIVSLAPRKPFAPKAFLGIGTEQADGGVRVGQLLPDTAAEVCGLQEGDVIEKINSAKVGTPVDLQLLIADFKPGDEIEIAYRRDGQRLKGKAILGTREINSRRMGRLEMMNRMSGPMSTRRDGFPRILQHDVPVQPTDCGGPLVDLSGEAVGINIARAGRVQSFAIATDDVLPLIEELKSGRLSPPEDFGKVEEESEEGDQAEVDQLNEDVQQLQNRGRRRRRRKRTRGEVSGQRLVVRPLASVELVVVPT